MGIKFLEAGGPLGVSAAFTLAMIEALHYAYPNQVFVNDENLTDFIALFCGS